MWSKIAMDSSDDVEVLEWMTENSSAFLSSKLLIGQLKDVTAGSLEEEFWFKRLFGVHIFPRSISDS